MRRSVLIVCAALLCSCSAEAQTFSSPTFQNVTILGSLTAQNSILPLHGELDVLGNLNVTGSTIQIGPMTFGSGAGAATQLVMTAGSTNVDPFQFHFSTAAGGIFDKLVTLTGASIGLSVTNGALVGGSLVGTGTIVGTGSIIAGNGGARPITLSSGAIQIASGNLAIGSSGADSLTVGNGSSTTALNGAVTAAGSGTGLAVTNDETVGGNFSVGSSITLGAGGNNFLSIIPGSTSSSAIAFQQTGTAGFTFSGNTRFFNQILVGNSTGQNTLTIAFGVNSSAAITLTPSLAGGIQIGNAASNTLFGSGSALATNATTGFPLMPTTTGAPTGAIGASGQGAIVLRTDNHKMCHSEGGGTWYYADGSACS